MTKVGFTKIKFNTIEEANKAIRESSITYMVLGAFLLVITFFVAELQNGFWDGILMIVLGWLLGKFKKTWIAVVLLILSTLQFIVTLQNKLVGTPGGTNIFLAAIMVWISIVAISATRYLQKSEPSKI